MTRSTHSESGLMQTLRLFALRYPEAEEGIACQGTALECSTFKAGNKAFLFLGAAELRLKLGDSLAEAARHAAKSPELYAVGAHGWVKVMLPKDQAPPPGLLERWIDESYRLLAPKKLVALLPAGGLPAGSPTKAAKKQAPPKKIAAKKGR
jgi:hypothetical protein